MAGVEQAGQDPDHRPGNARRDVADRRELRRAGKDEDTHRHHVDRGEAGLGPGREAVDEPETDATDHDPDAVEGESAAGAADGGNAGGRQAPVSHPGRYRCRHRRGGRSARDR